MEVRLIKFWKHVFLEFAFRTRKDHWVKDLVYHVNDKGRLGNLQGLMEIHYPLHSHVLVSASWYNRIIFHFVKSISGQLTTALIRLSEQIEQFISFDFLSKVTTIADALYIFEDFGGYFHNLTISLLYYNWLHIYTHIWAFYGGLWWLINVGINHFIRVCIVSSLNWVQWNCQDRRWSNT